MTMPQETVGANLTEQISFEENALSFLQLAARLLIEQSARSETIQREVGRLARHIGIDVSTSVAYREAMLSSSSGRCRHVHVAELRVDVSATLAISRVFDDLCADCIHVEEAMQRLEKIRRVVPEYRLWPLAMIFGAGASALAWILHGDSGAVVVSGVSSAAGLIVRKELGRRHARFFVLPFSAALIGALFGGIALIAGITQSPAICLIVPALMLVPGVHLIHSVQEALENHMEAGLARFGLSATILSAAALGILVGMKLVLGDNAVANSGSPLPLNLPLDIILAGVAASGFGAFFNTPWRVLWIPVVCGMLSHGIRYLGLEHGMSQELATLLGCLAIGVLAGLAVERLRLPFAAVAFAGAVSMMPGVFIYQALGGALKISAAGPLADPALVAGTVGLVVKAAIIVIVMAIGLLLGSRIVMPMKGEKSLQSR